MYLRFFRCVQCVTLSPWRFPALKPLQSKPLLTRLSQMAGLHSVTLIVAKVAPQLGPALRPSEGCGLRPHAPGLWPVLPACARIHSLAKGFFELRMVSRTGTAPKPSSLRIELTR